MVAQHVKARWKGFVEARHLVADAELAGLGDVKLVPGMSVEVFIQTSECTVLFYVIRSVYDQIKRAFGENDKPTASRCARRWKSSR